MEQCIICGEDIEKHDDWEATPDGPAHVECLEIEDEDLA